MISIFNTCYVKALTNWTDQISTTDKSLSFQYEIEKYQNQKMIAFWILILDPSEKNITFCFLLDGSNVVGLSVFDTEGNRIHVSEIISEDDMESRLFQIETVVNIYDLTSSMYNKLLVLYDTWM